MKVNRPEIINLIQKIQKQELDRGRNRPTSNGPAQTDRVEISSSSEALKNELARLEEADMPRAQRVAELARQIEAGEYKVDSRELADIILKNIEQG